MHVEHERVEGQRAVPEVREERAEPLRQRVSDRLRREVVLLEHFEYYERMAWFHLITANRVYSFNHRVLKSHTEPSLSLGERSQVS